MTSCDVEALHASISEALTLGNLCIMPPKQDGSKRPYPGNWTEYQKRKSTTEELLDWYSNGLTGFGIVCGAVSGQLEVMDFDQRDIFPEYEQACVAAGLGPLVERLKKGYMEHTPNGLHWLYRCSEIAGNTKLATRPKEPAEMKDQHDKVKVLIETRGEGGYIVAAPTYGTVHPSGIPYQLVSGSLSTIPEITPEERRNLHTIARMFHRLPPEKAAAEFTRATDSAKRADGRVGDDFNARGRWENILAGWSLVFERGGVLHLRRPGKTEGISGTIGWQGTDLFYCFTSSTEFEQNRTYDKFGAYAALHHGGDLKAAARDLGRQGYGDQGAKVDQGSKENAAEPPQRESLFESALDFLLQKVKVEYLIHRLLEVSSLILLIGPSGQFKSFIAICIACSIVTGRDWNGRKVKRGHVLYLAGEGHSGVKRRVAAYALANQLTPADLSGFYLSKHTLRMDGSNIDQILSEVSGLNVALVIIDTLARHLIGDENKAEDSGKFVDCVDRLKRELGAAALVVHHTGHDQTRGRGSSAIKGAADVEIMCDRGALTFTKMKDAEAPEPIEFKLSQVTIGQDDETGEPITSAVVEYGERSAQNKSGLLTRMEQLAVNALIEAAVKDRTTSGAGALVGDWRSTFYETRKADLRRQHANEEDAAAAADVSKKTLESSFKRAQEGLLAKKIIGEEGHLRTLRLPEHQEEVITRRTMPPMDAGCITDALGCMHPAADSGGMDAPPLEGASYASNAGSPEAETLFPDWARG